MSYSVSAILHNHKDKNGNYKVIIQVIYQRMKVYCSTTVKVGRNQFADGMVVKHDLKRDYNASIKEITNNIERRLLDALRINPNLTKDDLNIIVKDIKDTKISIISDFVYQFVEQGKLSKGRLKHYLVMAGKIERFKPNACFSDVSVAWLNNFEAWLIKQGLDGNTILSNMSLLKSVFAKAVEYDLIQENQFKAYKRPKYQQKMPSYLTEPEIEKFFNLVDVIEKPQHKLAGYYFLLSCMTGYRFGDATTFDYNDRVKDGKISLRTKKNKSIVSIPIHARLKKVLDFIKDKPINMSENTVREYVKELCSFVGLKEHKFHDSRHSFAMMLMNNGFTIDEVSELIGDTVLVTKVYARISNEQLSKKIIDKLG